MALVFPLARSAFYDLLPIRSAPFKLMRYEEGTRTAGGAYWPAAGFVDTAIRS